MAGVTWIPCGCGRMLIRETETMRVGNVIHKPGSSCQQLTQLHNESRKD